MLFNIFLLGFVVITWGYSWVLMKIGLQYMGPFTFAAWRCALAGVVMLPVLFLMRAPLPKREKWPHYALVGALQTTALFGLILFGMQFVTAGKTAVLLYTMPIWTSLIAHFYLKDTLHGWRWVGIASGALGLLCILGWDTITHQNIQILFGELLIVLAAVGWSVSNIWVKTRLADEDPFSINGFQTIIGSLGLVAIAFFAEGGGANILWTPMSVFAIVFTAIVATAVNFTIWFYLLRKIDTHTVAFSVLLVPVFGLLFDWVQLGSTLDAGVMVGGVLILYGIYRVSNY